MKNMSRGEIIGSIGILVTVVIFFLTRNKTVAPVTIDQNPAMTPVGLAATSIPAAANYGGSTYNFNSEPSMEPATSNLPASHHLGKLQGAISSAANTPTPNSTGCGCGTGCGTSSNGVSQNAQLSSFTAIALMNQYKNLLSVN